MKGSILFNKDINIEVDVDPSAEEGARLISAKNLVDGQEAGGGGDGGVATVTLVNNTGGEISNWWWAIINENMDAVFATNFNDSGTYLCPIYHEGQYIAYSFPTFDNLTLSGDAETFEIEGENFIIIKGDCTITIAAE